MLQKRKNEKRQKIPSDINFPRRTTTLPFKNLTLVKIFSKKSPQMPSNPLQGGFGVWKCDKSQLSFRIFKYFILAAVAVAAEITLFKNNFSLLSKKTLKIKVEG